VNADNAYIVNGADLVTVTDVVTDITKTRCRGVGREWHGAVGDQEQVLLERRPQTNNSSSSLMY
jgi:hypothetical protein